MKALKLVVLVSVFTSSAFAQYPGFFVTAGAGTAQMKVGDFVVYNPVASIPGSPLGEPLAARDKTSRVAVARLTLGCLINENWDIRFSYADYGTGNAQLAFPLYPGMASINPFDTYQRHELKYDTSTFTLLPTYTHALSEKFKLKVGAGLSYSETSAHIEASIKSYPATTFSNRSYAEVSENHLSYLVTLGVDYVSSDTFTIGLNGTSTTMKTKIPSSPWANRTKSDVNISSLGLELAVTWRW